MGTFSRHSVDMSKNVFFNPSPSRSQLFIPILVPVPRFSQVLFKFPSQSHQLFPFLPTTSPTQESYSLPVLLYAIPALSLRSRQIDELNVCWNNVIRRLFNYSKWESVKAVILGLVRLNVSHLIMLRKVNFYRHLYTSKNRILSCALHSFMLRRCDVMANSAFSHKFSVVQTVYDKFAAYVAGFN